MNNNENIDDLNNYDLNEDESQYEYNDNNDFNESDEDNENKFQFQVDDKIKLNIKDNENNNIIVVEEQDDVEIDKNSKYFNIKDEQKDKKVPRLKPGKHFMSEKDYEAKQQNDNNELSSIKIQQKVKISKNSTYYVNTHAGEIYYLPKYKTENCNDDPNQYKKEFNKVVDIYEDDAKVQPQTLNIYNKDVLLKKPIEKTSIRKIIHEMLEDILAKSITTMEKQEKVSSFEQKYLNSQKNQQTEMQ